MTKIAQVKVKISKIKYSWAYLEQQLVIASNSEYRLHPDCGQKVSLILDFLQNIECFLESIWVLRFDPLNRNLPFVVFSRGLCWYLENLQNEINVKSLTENFKICMFFRFAVWLSKYFDCWWSYKTQKFGRKKIRFRYILIFFERKWKCWFISKYCIYKIKFYVI